MSNDLISREALKKAIKEKLGVYIDGTLNNRLLFGIIDNAPTVEANSIIDGLNNEIDDLSENLAWYINERNRLLKERRPQGEWKDYSDEGFLECPFCQHATTCEDNIDELHYCWNCGAKLKKGGAE